MIRTRHRALHFPYAPTAANLRHAARILDHIAAAGLHTASPAALLSGASADHVLLSIAIPDHAGLTAWLDALAPTASSALLALPSDLLDLDPDIARDLALLPGLGLVTASAGASGAPLHDLPLAALRPALITSRARLEAACHHPVTTLLIPPSPRGLSLDALLTAEARAAGYTTLLAPARSPDHALATLRRDTSPDIIWTRHVRPDDRAPAILRWLLA